MSDTLELPENASHDPFDKRVAMTMVIVAACLALVSTMGHQTGNEALALHSEHASLKVQESNAWSQYQSKRMRQHTNEKALMMLQLLANAEGTKDDRSKREVELRREVARYKLELKGEGALNDKDKDLLKEDKEAEKSRKEPPLDEKARGYEKLAEKTKAEAEFLHQKTVRLEYAHLGIELGLVLCSVAILTKRKPFWLVGIGVTLIGIGITVSALMMKESEAEHPETKHVEKG